MLEAKNLFADWFATRLIAEGKANKIKVMTPDSGGLGRCERFRNVLLKRLNALGAKIDDIEIVIFDKLRIKGEVRGGRIVGDVGDSDVIAFDDMISTASTMKKACRAVETQKGRVYAICASHGLFCGKANEILDDMDTKIVVSDTINPWRLNDKNRGKLHVVDTTKMVAEAICVSILAPAPSANFCEVRRSLRLLLVLDEFGSKNGDGIACLNAKANLVGIDSHHRQFDMLIVVDLEQDLSRRAFSIGLAFCLPSLSLGLGYKSR
jgi:hypothetical protein